MSKDAIQKLHQFLASTITLTENDLHDFLSLLSYVEIPKAEKLISSGRKCEKMYFLIDGFVKYQLIQHNKKKVLHIAGNGVLVSDFFSFYSDNYAITDIITLCDCKLFSIDKQVLENLYMNNLIWANFGRKIAENAVVNQIMKRISIQTLSAEERYINILTSNAELFKVVKLGDLAESLGITQETLSRIRSRLS